jgi:polar amino acid transport system permease protein
LGGAKTSAFAYPHPDWRLYYFIFLLVFYLCMTRLSEVVLTRLQDRLSLGQATASGEAQRKVAA